MASGPASAACAGVRLAGTVGASTVIAASVTWRGSFISFVSLMPDPADYLCASQSTSVVLSCPSALALTKMPMWPPFRTTSV